MIMGKEDIPVAIIGASAAGLFAACHLARRGVPVRVFEAQTPFQPEERTLIVTPAFLRLVDFDVRDAVLNRVTTFELISHRQSVRIPLREADVILDRARFLHLLACRVQEAGGEVLFGYRLKGIIRGGPRYMLGFAAGPGRERWVPAIRFLGADGVGSTVARLLGQDSLERVALSQARVPLPADLPADTVRVWFDRRTTRFFYWLIPESPRFGVAGLIAEAPQEARLLLERFLQAQGLEAIAWQESAVPLFPLLAHRAPRGNGHILLAGDAAGQVKATTVGGLVAGMRGGLAAAQALLRGTFYDAELRPLNRELALHALIRWVLDGFTNEDYDTLLSLLNARGLAVLGRYHRDELGWALWRLLLSQPRWLWLGARALVQRTRAPIRPSIGGAMREQSAQSGPLRDETLG